MTISKKEFVEKLKALPKKIKSKTGRVTYTNIVVKDDTISFVRETGNTRHIEIDDLYTAYKKLKEIDTIKIQGYLKQWVYSPGCAILIGMGLYDMKGNRIEQ